MRNKIRLHPGYDKLADVFKRFQWWYRRRKYLTDTSDEENALFNNILDATGYNYQLQNEFI